MHSLTIQLIGQISFKLLMFDYITGTIKYIGCAASMSLNPIILINILVFPGMMSNHLTHKQHRIIGLDPARVRTLIYHLH